MTTPARDFSIQMQRRAHLVVVQNPPEPGDLVRGLEKRVLAVDGPDEERPVSWTRLEDECDRPEG